MLSISPLLRELMAAATEVPLDWQPGTRDGRLMMLLLDELRQEPVLPLHLPQPAEPRLARICRAIVRHPGGRTAWPTGPLNWGGSQDGAAPVPAPYRHDLRPLAPARLLAAMERLARGERVLDVALDLGYESERLRGHVPQGLGRAAQRLRGARGRPPEGCRTGAGIRAQAGANLA